MSERCVHHCFRLFKLRFKVLVKCEFVLPTILADLRTWLRQNYKNLTIFGNPSPGITHIWKWLGLFMVQEMSIFPINETFIMTQYCTRLARLWKQEWRSRSQSDPQKMSGAPVFTKLTALPQSFIFRNDYIRTDD